VREPPQLGGDVVDLTGELTRAEERTARGDRLCRRCGRQVEGDIRRRGRCEGGQPFVMERRDRSEARVFSGELSPAGAGLIDLEGGRDV
jgi:hypothetical protein